MKHKILQVQAGMNRAGTEAVIMGWYRTINRDEIQFEFTNMMDEECAYDKEIINKGGKIIKLPSRGKVGNIKHCKALYKAIKENGPYTAVHSHMNFHGGIVALISKLAGVKTVVCHAHNTQDEGTGLKRKLEIFVLRNLMLLLSDKLLACGEEAGKFVFGKNKFEVINNSVDIEEFKPNINENVKELKCKYNLNNCLVLGHIGRFSEQKNHKFILEIIESLKLKKENFKFILIGDGELREEFFKEVKTKKLEDYIIYLGLRDDISSWLNIMDILVFPSLFEGLPVILVEAQATGLPCIISKNISKEVDLGLNLVEFLNINDANIWSEQIINNGNKRVLDNSVIKEAMKKRGYLLEINTKRVVDIYLRK